MGERIEKSHLRQKDFFVGIGIMRRKSLEALMRRLSQIYEVVLSWEGVDSGGAAQSSKSICLREVKKEKNVENKRNARKGKE